MRTDADLIREARRNPEAFGELYRRHAERLHRWLLARAPAHIASELTAETFAQAAVHLKRFRDEADGSCAPWLFGIAKNLLRRYYEKERVETESRRRLGMPVHSYEDFGAVDERASMSALQGPLRAALDKLPRNQRQALELRIVDELAYDEVASRLGCSEVAARLRVMRALGSLSRQLGVVER